MRIDDLVRTERYFSSGPMLYPLLHGEFVGVSALLLLAQKNPP